MAWSIFDYEDADLDVMGHPLLNMIYYSGAGGCCTCPVWPAVGAALGVVLGAAPCCPSTNLGTLVCCSGAAHFMPKFQACSPHPRLHCVATTGVQRSSPLAWCSTSCASCRPSASSRATSRSLRSDRHVRITGVLGHHGPRLQPARANLQCCLSLLWLAPHKACRWVFGSRARPAPGAPPSPRLPAACPVHRGIPPLPPNTSSSSQLPCFATLSGILTRPLPRSCAFAVSLCAAPRHPNHRTLLSQQQSRFHTTCLCSSTVNDLTDTTTRVGPSRGRIAGDALHYAVCDTLGGSTGSTPRDGAAIHTLRALTPPSPALAAS